MTDGSLAAQIAEVIATHQPTVKRICHPRRFGFMLNITACKGCAWADEGGDHGAHLAAVILEVLRGPGYAIVKLPEPQFYPDDERGDVIHFSGSSHSYFPEPGGRITDDSNSQVWESASDAKEDAAAILAAVSEVEK